MVPVGGLGTKARTGALVDGRVAAAAGVAAEAGRAGVGVGRSRVAAEAGRAGMGVGRGAAVEEKGAVERQVVRLGGWNVGQGGMIDELDIERVKVVLDERKIALLGVTEHWRGKKMRAMREVEREVGGGGIVRESGKKCDGVEELLGEKYQWIERCRSVTRRGGGGVGNSEGVWCG